MQQQYSFEQSPPCTDSDASSYHDSLASSPIVLEDPPSDEEARLYYYGLPSGPRLVARSSGVQWHHIECGETHPRVKFLKHVGKHHIIDEWNAQLQKQIIDVLSPAEWTSVDILRIGYRHPDIDCWCPVVLWIGVTSGSLAWRDGMTIVNACIGILKSYELHDIECEIRESQVWELAQTPPPVPYLRPVSDTNVTAEYQLPLTASPGQAIGPEGTRVEGTLGLYLKPGDSSPQSQSIWALTCRHVVHAFDNKETYRFKPTTGQPHKYMLLPGNTTIGKMKEDAKLQLDLQADSVKYNEDRLKQCKPEEEQECKKAVDESSTMFKDSREFWENILPKWQSEANRRLGHVVFGPPNEAADPIDTADAFGPRRDWALIELDQTKFTEPVTNAVDILIGLGISRQRLVAMLHTNPASPHKFRMPLDGKLHIQQTVPIGELKRPKMLDKDGNQCLIVGKRGRSTGITWGCCNEVKSIVHDGSTTTMEWCVVPGIDRKAFAPFSDKGDSGSAIFDVHGRVAGILTSGSGLTATSDVTYITPMAWLQQDMKKYGHSVEIM